MTEPVDLPPASMAEKRRRERAEAQKEVTRMSNENAIATITYTSTPASILIEPNLDHLSQLPHRQLEYIINHEAEHFRQKLWEMVRKHWTNADAPPTAE